MKIYIALLLVFLMSACSEKEQKTARENPNTDLSVLVAVTNYPLHYFVTRIAGDNVTPYFPEIEGDPAFWKPSSEELQTFQQADLIVLNGASYETWLPYVTLPEDKMVNTSYSLSNPLIKNDKALAHKHGPEGEHEHGATAFTTWLDLQQASQQAAAVKDALTNVRPDKAGLFQKNFIALQKELLSLDQKLRSIGNRLQHTPLLFSHPVYQYFQRRYGFSGHALHWEPDRMPDERQWQQLELLNKELKAQWMIWEDQPSKDITKRLETLNIHSVVFNPASNHSENEKQDFIAVMNTNVANLAAIERNHLEAGK
ncbi:MAG: zinc ABC transporter substrate-binding protein [Nitrospina sp.]|nr:MAG: zinc ABC transporter substrate-binding protein [Nitrospina sp.]